jgi:NADH-quinone oxidoreductase subunit K
MHNVVGYTMVLMLIGMFGILCSKRNIIVLLVEIELMLLASNFNFIVFSFWLDDSVGYI